MLENNAYLQIAVYVQGLHGQLFSSEWTEIQAQPVYPANDTQRDSGHFI